MYRTGVGLISPNFGPHWTAGGILNRQRCFADCFPDVL